MQEKSDPSPPDRSFPWDRRGRTPGDRARLRAGRPAPGDGRTLRSSGRSRITSWMDRAGSGEGRRLDLGRSARDERLGDVPGVWRRDDPGRPGVVLSGVPTDAAGGADALAPAPREVGPVPRPAGTPRGR